MLIITCPYCGPREEPEFGYGRQAHVAYPADPSALSDAEWAHYLFYRDNPRGLLAERWVHSVGCRRWFNVVRDTVTYEIKAVYRSGEQPPGEHASLVAREPGAIGPDPGEPTHEQSTAPSTSTTSTEG